jgi:hypothetical protein
LNKAETLHCGKARGVANRPFAALSRQCLLFVALVILFAAGLSMVVAQSGSQPLEAPRGKAPIPRVWIIAGASVALLAGCGLLYASIRAWRSSNLFDREYHFPPAGPSAMRFGGARSGGLMATIDFRKSDEK